MLDFGGMGSMGGNPAGNALGASGMDLSMHKLPLLGPLLFKDPNEIHQQQMYHQMASNYSAYRPEQAQAYLNSLRQQSALLQPMNNLMASRYGLGAQMPFQQGYTNPMSPRMQTIGNAFNEPPASMTENVTGGFGGGMGIPGMGGGGMMGFPPIFGGGG